MEKIPKIVFGFKYIGDENSLRNELSGRLASEALSEARKIRQGLIVNILVKINHNEDGSWEYYPKMFTPDTLPESDKISLYIDRMKTRMITSLTNFGCTEVQGYVTWRR